MIILLHLHNRHHHLLLLLLLPTLSRQLWRNERIEFEPSQLSFSNPPTAWGDYEVIVDLRLGGSEDLARFRVTLAPYELEASR